MQTIAQIYALFMLLQSLNQSRAALLASAPDPYSAGESKWELSGEESAKSIAEALQDPTIQAKLSAEVAAKELMSGNKDQYVGGASDAEGNRKQDAEDLVSDKRKPAIPNSCIRPRALGECCYPISQITLPINLRTPPKQLIGAHLPTKIIEVSKSSYESRILSKSDIEKGCKEVDDLKRTMGAEAVKRRIKELSGKDGVNVNQQDIDKFMQDLEKAAGKCITDTDGVVIPTQIAREIPATLLMRDYVSQLEQIANVSPGAFGKLRSVVSPVLSKYEPVAFDRGNGYKYMASINPEKAAELVNPRSALGYPVSDIAIAHKLMVSAAKSNLPGALGALGLSPFANLSATNGGLEPILLRMMATGPNRPDVPEFRRIFKPMPRIMPYFPGKFFGLAPLGISILPNASIQAFYQMSVLSGLLPERIAAGKQYPIFEVMPYALGGTVGDKFFIQSNPYGDATKCYGVDKGAAQTSPDEIFKYEEFYGGNKFLQTLRDRLRFDQYVVFTYMQMCPEMHFADPLVCDKGARAPDMNPWFEYYGSFATPIFPPPL